MYIEELVPTDINQLKAYIYITGLFGPSKTVLTVQDNAGAMTGAGGT